MKKIIFVLALLSTVSVNAQEKKEVYSIVEEHHTLEWNQEQLKIWKLETEKNGLNANNWYNYYVSARNCRNLSMDEGERTIYRKLCAEITETLLKKLPESFEANYIKYWQDGNNMKQDEHLLKAAKISPGDRRLFDDLMILHYRNEDAEKFKQSAVDMYNTNEFAPSMLNWAYNILSELDSNAILFTAGDNDTFTLWVAQQAKGIRTDVTIINTSLIRLPIFRDRIFKKLGIDPFEGEITHADRYALLSHIMNNKKVIPVYVSISAMHDFDTSEFEQNLYLNGLSYKYSAESYDNTSILRRNYEKRYMVDYLKMSFSTHRMDGLALHFKWMYASVLGQLYHIYSDSEDTDKAKEIADLIKIIAEGSPNENELLKMIGC